MTRSKPQPVTPEVVAVGRRVLEALAVSRLPSQVDRETVEDAVALDAILEAEVLPVSWRILADRYQAEDAADVEADPTLLDGVE